MSTAGRRMLELTVVFLLLSAIFPVPGRCDAGVEGVKVLIYFSPSNFTWVKTTDAGDAFEALLEASRSLGWSVEWENSIFGVFITSIRGVRTPPDYSYFWALLVWNSTEQAWEYASTSADTTSLQPGDAVAYFYCHTYGEVPDPTPAEPYPVLCYSSVLSIQGPPWSPGEFAQIKKVHLSSGPIDASPVVTPEGVLVFTSGIMNYTSFRLEKPSSLYLLDEDGDVIWETEIGGVGFELSTPLVRASRVYVASTDGNLRILNLTGGRLIKVLKLDNSTWGFTASPVVDERRIYLAGGDGNLTALTPDGALLWRVRLNTTFYFSTPALLNGEIYLGGRDGKVFAVNTTSGEVVWDTALNGTIKSPLVAGPGGVYFSINTGENRGEIYRIEAGSHRLRRVKELPTALTSSLNIFRLEEDWALAAGFEGGVYLVKYPSGELKVLPAEGPVMASPLMVGGRLLFVTNTGGAGNLSTLYLYTPEGELLDTFVPVPNSWIFPTPLVHSSTVYLPTDAGDLHIVGLLPPFRFHPDNITLKAREGEFSFAVFANGTPGGGEITWYVDGREVARGSRLNVSLTPGEHNVTAVIVIGEVKLIRTWLVSVESAEGGGNEGGAPAPGYYIIVAIPVALFIWIAIYYYRRKGFPPGGGMVEE